MVVLLHCNTVLNHAPDSCYVNQQQKCKSTFLFFVVTLMWLDPHLYAHMCVHVPPSASFLPGQSCLHKWQLCCRAAAFEVSDLPDQSLPALSA